MKAVGRLYFLLTIFLLSLTARPAHGYLTSDFDFNVGFSSFVITVGDVERTLESLSTLEFGYNLIYSRANMAFNLSFQEIVSSEFGLLPYTRIAFGPRWYPRGLNGKKIIFDNQVKGKVWRPSPFVGLQGGLSNFSIQDNSDAQRENDVNAAVIDANVEMGVEIPVTQDWLLVGQFSYSLAVVSGGGDQRPEFTFSGIQMFVGLKITSF